MIYVNDISNKEVIVVSVEIVFLPLSSRGGKDLTAWPLVEELFCGFPNQESLLANKLCFLFMYMNYSWMYLSMAINRNSLNDREGQSDSTPVDNYYFNCTCTLVAPLYPLNSLWL